NQKHFMEDKPEELLLSDSERVIALGKLIEDLEISTVDLSGARWEDLLSAPSREEVGLEIKKNAVKKRVLKELIADPDLKIREFIIQILQKTPFTLSPSRQKLLTNTIFVELQRMIDPE